MSDDFPEDLKSWLAQMVADEPHRKAVGGSSEIEIDYLRRAIAEIERLRDDTK